MNRVREARDTHLFDAVDDDDEKVGTGKRDKGYKGSFRIGDAMFVSGQSKLGQLILTSRQIEKAKQSRRTAKENAVKAGKNDLAKAERSEAGGKRDGGRSAHRGPAGKDAAPATVDKGRAKAPSPVVKVPVELDVWKRTYGEKFNANKFTEVCKLTERETLEKATWKHVAFFTKNGWDYRANRQGVRHAPCHQGEEVEDSRPVRRVPQDKDKQQKLQAARPEAPARQQRQQQQRQRPPQRREAKGQ